MPNGTSPKAKATARRYLKKTAKERARRNRDRRKAIREGRARKGDGKDVHHTAGGARGTTAVTSQTKNRGWRKGRKGPAKGKKGT